MKICDKCGTEKEEEKFKKTGHSWRRNTCKTCVVKAAAKWKREGTSEARKEQHKRRYRRLKATVLSHYGDRCACCGEEDEAFLCLDHIEGGGGKHRKEFKSKQYCILDWIVKNGFPPMFQILCANCNQAKYTKGVCPHKSGTGVTLRELYSETEKEQREAEKRNADKSRQTLP